MPSDPTNPPPHESTAKITAGDLARAIDEAKATSEQGFAEMRAHFADLERKLADAVATIEAKAATLPAVPTAYASPPAGAVADDADLDGQWGNPVVKRDPPRWSGDSYAGATYSQCPPEYLDTLAGFLEWQARKSDEKSELANNGKPRSQYQFKDAARARGWASRLRAKAPAGARPKPRAVEAVPGYDDTSDDPVPFLTRANPSPVGRSLGAWPPPTMTSPTS